MAYEALRRQPYHTPPVMSLADLSVTEAGLVSEGVSEALGGPGSAVDPVGSHPIHGPATL